jgi:chromosomal replication initiation ATPase DnaA
MVPVSEYRIRDMVKAYNHIRDSYRLMHSNLTSMGVISGELDIREFKEKEIIAPSVIIKLVEGKFGQDVRIKSQKNDIMLARHAMAFLFDKFTILSYREIAPHCGQSHHTTVMNSIKTCSDLMDSNAEYKKQINEMEKELRDYLKRTKS